MSTPHESRDAELTDYVDEVLEDAARADLEAIFARDPALARELEDAQTARSLLRGLEPQPVPRDFLRKVRRKVRRRSARMYDPHREVLGLKLSVEVFAVVAVAVMLALYFMGDLGRRATVELHLEHDGGVSAPSEALPSPPAKQ